MSKAMTKEEMALPKEAGEMFNETGCVPDNEGEQVPAERIVPDAKEYILESIDDPEAIYDPEIWETPGFTLGHLEKSLSLPGVCVSGANAYESKREQSGIICRQFSEA